MRDLAWLVVNGKAATDPELRSAVSQVRERGARAEVRVTFEAGDAERWTHEGVEAGADVVVACGGDGTVGAVAAALAAAQAASTPALALVPMGTANDLAAAADLPLADPVAALTLALEGAAYPIDLGVLEVAGEPPWYFANAVTLGPGATVTSTTPESWKGALGGAAYLVNMAAGAGRVKPASIEVEADDLEFRGPAWGVAALNGRMVGPRVNLAPEARLDDGLLDLVLVSAEASPWAVGAALEIATSAAEDDTARSVLRARVASVSLATDGIDFTVDGEPGSAASLRLRIAPGAVRCVLPRGCPLVSAGE